MRKINFLIILLLVGLNNSGFSQVLKDYGDFSIFIGDVQKSNSSIESLARTPDGQLLCVQNKASFFRSFSRNKSKYSFDAIDKNFTLPSYNPRKFYGDGKKSKLFNYTFIGNQILGISSRTSFFNRSPDLYYHAIDPNREESNNYGYSLSDLNLGDEFINLSRISMVSSEDKTSAAIVYVPKTKQEEHSDIKYTVFKNDSTTPLERAFLFPYTSSAYEPLDFSILNFHEQLFFAGHFPKNNRQDNRSRQKRVFSKISITKIGENGKTSQTIENTGYYFTAVKVVEDEDSGVVLSGLYTTNKNGYKVEGVLIAKINSDGEIVNKTFTPITLNKLKIMEDQEEDAFPNPTNSDLEYSKFTILNFRKVGENYVCVAELNALEYRYGAADIYGRTSSLDTYFWSGDLLVLKIDPQGELIWGKVAPKMQRTINDGGYYLSSSVYFDENKVHLFFNDNLSNYNNERHYIKYGSVPDLAHFNSSKNTIAHVSIQFDNGKMSRECTVGREETNVLFVPKLSVPFEKKNRLIIYGQNGNKHRLGSIHFSP